MSQLGQHSEPTGTGSRFSDDLMFRAANAYYVGEQNQVQIAESLGVSRPTVSRLLSEARRRGIVEIRVHRPQGEGAAELEEQCATALGIKRVFVSTGSNVASVGARLASGVNRALDEADLQTGDALLISSGQTLYEVVQQDLSPRPGVDVAPMVGGLDEPEPWWQTNELTRLYAQRVGGRAHYLFAPALPSALLSESLKLEPSFKRVTGLWDTAKAALIGVGAPPLLRSQRAAFFPREQRALTASVGDVCSRFFDGAGEPVPYEGAERLVAITPQQLTAMPAAIAVAAGPEKVASIVAAVRGGYLNQLVTDAATARMLVEQAAAVR
ncbi:sugar-binding transcriptional regulator [Terracoccus luteus]|jgi:DNA-binding transcriptional regulator LsrR (DeoR family)|uniref:DNA-binding transcriptional regulator LsrR (DeoR family) n=1 Tax=Terracoccus luteus TaxID=53356 RepID=A0A495XR96_9MICO|nr:sugar-binding domain-containing protein [Terracoccus luteus]MBB2988064.1 DNA-binding transcriptional regulator LsrR (DeoR family) [Terracoccus luteus]MCP2173715.1 DNA-binding transcriptional regulator LsrR (DeoR family) [Terracoccus luteus]RKT76617.1 DeoR family transcriptional regulator [Terracoccus luteus]